MHMFTDELHIMDRNMDRNMERLMVSELQDEVNELRSRVDTAETGRNVFKLRLEGKASEEIAKELSVSIEKVKEILGENAQEPKEWMLTFTDKLHIMDRHMERLMVRELQDEVNKLKTELTQQRQSGMQC